MPFKIKKIRKILCATDGSHSAAKAVEHTLSMASALTDVDITFLLVTRVDVSPADARYLGTTLLDAANIQEHMELEAALKRAREVGIGDVHCVKANARRNFAAAIVDYAEKEKMDHIIMGSTGRTGVARMLLGSVAAEVVHKAHCPVTIVR